MPPLSIMSIAGFGEIGLIELDDQGDPCGASGLPLAHILATRVGPVDHLIAVFIVRFLKLLNKGRVALRVVVDFLHWQDYTRAVK